MLNDYRDYGKHVRILKNTLEYLDGENKNIVNSEMHDVELDGSLIVPVGSYSFDTYESGMLANSYKRMISHLKYCINRGISLYTYIYFFKIKLIIKLIKIIIFFFILKIIKKKKKKKKNLKENENV